MSRVAQWKRAGPITQRSVDRNYDLLYDPWKGFKARLRKDCFIIRNLRQSKGVRKYKWRSIYNARKMFRSFLHICRVPYSVVYAFCADNWKHSTNVSLSCGADLLPSFVDGLPDYPFPVWMAWQRGNTSDHCGWEFGKHEASPLMHATELTRLSW